VIDYFFYQRKDTLQIIGQYGVLAVRIMWVTVFAVILFGFNIHVSDRRVHFLISATYMMNVLALSVFLFPLLRNYAKGHIFSVKNTGQMVWIGLSFLFFLGGSAAKCILGAVASILFLVAAIVVPSHDQDTPKADA
jgi:hypothetical protein